MSDPRPPSPPSVSPAPPSDPNPQSSTQLPSPASIENALHARIDAFSPLCPSARTSYTRVDFTGGTGANTPRPDFTGDADLEDSEQIEDAQPAAEDAIPQTPQVSLTFLLVSGRRRTMSFEPETTVGRVKELVWNSWLNEWKEERPPAPSYLRILYLGRILQDEDTLDKLGLPTQLPSATPSSTIVHLSIRVYAPPSEEVHKKKRRSMLPSHASAPGAGAEDQNAGCCPSCIIC